MQDMIAPSVDPRKMLSITSICHTHTLYDGDNNVSVNHASFVSDIESRISKEKYTENVKKRDRSLPYKS